MNRIIGKALLGMGLAMAAVLLPSGVVAAEQSATEAPSRDLQELRQKWGVLADMVGHDWLRVYLSGKSFPRTYSWKVPGKSILEKSEDEETVYTLAPDGSILYVTTPTPGWELPSDHVFQVTHGGDALTQRVGRDRSGRLVRLRLREDVDLFADYYGCIRGLPQSRRREMTQVDSPYYRLALIFITLVPLPFAFVGRPITGTILLVALYGVEVILVGQANYQQDQQAFLEDARAQIETLTQEE